MGSVAEMELCLGEAGRNAQTDLCRKHPVGRCEFKPLAADRVPHKKSPAPDRPVTTLPARAPRPMTPLTSVS